MIKTPTKKDNEKFSLLTVS